MKSNTELKLLVAVVGAVIALAGSGTALSACGVLDRTGEIMEMEEGRNGVKAEINNGNNDDYEVYLIPNTECDEGDRIDDCADRDDYLVAPSGAVPGLNGNNSDRDDD